MGLLGWGAVKSVPVLEGRFVKSKARVLVGLSVFAVCLGCRCKVALGGENECPGDE